MNCDWLKTSTAFDCVPIRGLHGEQGVEIGTPFSYADGSAIVLYALEQGDRVLLSDNVGAATVGGCGPRNLHLGLPVSGTRLSVR